MMLLNSLGVISQPEKVHLVQATTFLLTIALAAMGLETDVLKLRGRAGSRCSLAPAPGCSSRHPASCWLNWSIRELERTVSTILKASAVGVAPAADAPLDEIIALGRRALRHKRSEERALDLLGLDGVRLPLDDDPGMCGKAGERILLGGRRQSLFAGRRQRLGSWGWPSGSALWALASWGRRWR